jgi:hypothetical protein
MNSKRRVAEMGRKPTDTAAATPSKKQAKKPRKKKPKTGRKPHNATQPADYSSLAELISKVGDEPRKVLVRGQEVNMSRSERLLRLQVDRALQGNVREVANIIRLMIKYPDIAASYREEKVVLIAGIDADA